MDCSVKISCRLIVFDMDGTLTHDALDFESLRVDLGLAERRPVLEWMEALPAADRLRPMEILQEHERRAAETCRLRAGVVKLLQDLRRQNVQTALLTRNSRQSAQRILDRHQLKFEVLVSRDEPPYKPHPESLQRILQHHGFTGSEALMVGDYIFDLQVAQAAGVQSVLLVDAGKPLPPFIELANFCIHDITEITAVLAEPERFRTRRLMAAAPCAQKGS